MFEGRTYQQQGGYKGWAIRFAGYHRNLADGSVADNTELYDGCSDKELKAAFCSNCHEPIGTVKDVPDQSK